MAQTIDEIARELVKKISDAAIELAFTRHELTTTEYEDADYGVEEGVEAFKGIVESVKADVLAVLTGDDTGCLDPEDIDYDNEAEFTKSALLKVAKEQRERDAAICDSYKNETYAIDVRDTAEEIAREIRTQETSNE